MKRADGDAFNEQMKSIHDLESKLKTHGFEWRPNVGVFKTLNEGSTSKINEV